MSRLIGPNRSVLDCGCSSGKIAGLLARQGSRVTGIEMNPDRAAQAEASCERVIRGDLTAPETWAQLQGKSFNVILLSHVLEHVTDPLQVIRNALRHLVSGGRVVAVLPNVANWRIRLQLLLGRWEYQAEGILDRTHLRFYTLDTAAQFLRSAGLEIQQVHVVLQPASGGTGRRAAVRALRRLLPPAFLAVSMIFDTRVSAQG